MRKFLAVMCCLVLVLCSSCGKTTIKKETAQQLIIQELDILIKTTEDPPTLLNLIKNSAEIAVVGIEETEEGSFAVCDVSNYDVEPVLSEYLENNSSKEMTNEEFIAEITEAFEEKGKTTTQIRVLINIVDKKPGSASLTDEQLDIILGGYMSYSKTFVESLSE